MTSQAEYRTDAGLGWTFHSLISPSGDLEACCCVLDGNASKRSPNVLASTRLVQTPLGARLMRTRLRQQAGNLEKKLHLIDALELCGAKIANQFRTARAFVIAAESVPSAHAWSLAADLWKQVALSENVRVIT